MLVTKLRHHGDVLLISPVLNVLRRRFPEAEIDALVYRETRAMLEGHPALSHLHLVDKGGSLGQEWRLLQGLRQRRPDLLVHLTTSNRGAWLARLLKPRLAVAPSYSGKFYRASFTHLYRHVNARPIVECNLDALRRLGIRPEPEDKRAVLVPGPEAEAAAEQVLEEFGLRGGAFILIHPTSRWLFKCWPVDKVAALADALEERGLPVLFTSGPDAQERAMVEAIRVRAARPLRSVAGRLSLKELAALLGRARLFIGMDSAPMHMAAAMGTPVVALFGPSGQDIWGPWMTPYRVISSDHTCRPCGQDGCGGSKRSDCLETIPVQQVLDAALELLETRA